MRVTGTEKAAPPATPGTQALVILSSNEASTAPPSRKLSDFIFFEPSSNNNKTHLVEKSSFWETTHDDDEKWIPSYCGTIKFPYNRSLLKSSVEKVSDESSLCLPCLKKFTKWKYEMPPPMRISNLDTSVVFSDKKLELDDEYLAECMRTLNFDEGNEDVKISKDNLDFYDDSELKTLNEMTKKKPKNSEKKTLKDDEIVYADDDNENVTPPLSPKPVDYDSEVENNFSNYFHFDIKYEPPMQKVEKINECDGICLADEAEIDDEYERRRYMSKMAYRINTFMLTNRGYDPRRLRNPLGPYDEREDEETGEIQLIPWTLARRREVSGMESSTYYELWVAPDNVDMQNLSEYIRTNIGVFPGVYLQYVHILGDDDTLGRVVFSDPDPALRRNI
jgi:hypothetical protein